MKQRPILFNGDMVRAILNGQKTQTRRAVKPHRSDDAFCLQDFNDGNGWWPYRSEDGESPFMDGNEYPLSCPFGSVGDQLWVRETFGIEVRSQSGGTGEFYAYRATKPDAVYCTTADGGSIPMKWVPSIHMPRKVSRITLEITSIRVERLQDISEEDAEKEGIDFLRQVPDMDETMTAKELFECLWDSIYKNWNENPWVWVIEFKRVEQ